jgi:type I restriction enzyme S subunit
MGESAGRVKARDLIDFNPITRTAKDGEIPFIEMAALPTDHRYIPEIGRRMPSSSGSKFKDGDTLFARITPCLENGKGGFVSGLGAGVVGQGSTEFIVFRAKDPRDEDFVYYLSRLPEFRLFAEKGMSGTSGRQRVAWQTLAEFSLPNLDPDHRQVMGAILSSLDDKIELNRQMNQTLQALARAVFEDWFVNFGPTRRKMAGETDPAAILGGLLPPATATPLAPLFPNQFGENGLPLGWEPKTLGDIAEPRKGRSITKKTVTHGTVPVVAGGLSPAYYHDTANVSGPVITASASGANAGFVRLYNQDIWASDCSYISREQTDHLFTIYALLSSRQDEIYSMQQGAAQPHIYPSDLKRLAIADAPRPIWQACEELLAPMFEQIASNEQENQTLAATRDLLLPKLMSGELRLVGEME